MPESGKILVVDDEAVIRELLTDLLTEEGYDVQSVGCGRTALNVLTEEDDFILLFTDIIMPEMDGLSLIREAHKVRPALIPIVMTGFATLETARAAVKEGVYDYVLKPFSLSEIKLAVTNAFERHRLTWENARLREITELFKISESVATIRDEERLLDFVLRASLDRVGAERGSLMLATDDGNALRVAKSMGIPVEDTRALVPMGHSISGWVAQNRQPLFVQDISKNPGVEEMSRRLRDASFISVPLERRLQRDGKIQAASNLPQVLAVLNVTKKRDGGPFTEGDLKTLSIVANHASVALENLWLLRDIEKSHLSMLQSMALLLEAKDAYTHGHSERVRNYSVMAGLKLGFSLHDIETLRLGAALHDLGKIGVSDSVLNKVEQLTSEEWESIKRHPVIGYDVLSPTQFLTPEHLSLVRSHHERLDGSGYPDALHGEELSDLVRVLAVADSYDAMSSDRAYRTGMSPPEVVNELKRCGGDKLDRRISDLFIELIESGEIEQYENYEPSLLPKNGSW
jgi:response regulator RpfG family c-di-GMP phosphodiesterase